MRGRAAVGKREVIWLFSRVIHQSVRRTSDLLPTCSQRKRTTDCPEAGIVLCFAVLDGWTAQRSSHPDERVFELILR